LALSTFFLNSTAFNFCDALAASSSLVEKRGKVWEMAVENQARCSSLPATVFQSGGDNLPAKRDLKVATVGTF